MSADVSKQFSPLGVAEMRMSAVDEIRTDAEILFCLTPSTRTKSSDIKVQVDPGSNSA